MESHKIEFLFSRFLKVGLISFIIKWGKNHNSWGRGRGAGCVTPESNVTSEFWVDRKVLGCECMMFKITQFTLVK